MRSRYLQQFSESDTAVRLERSFMRFKMLVILLIFLLAALLVSAQRYRLPDSVWFLEGNRRAFLGDNFFDVNPSHDIVGVVIIPEPVTADIVGAAWTYAVRYGADGLDLPNYQRAIEILMERHPTWAAYTTNGGIIRYGQYQAEMDTQDPTLTPMPEASETP